MKILRRSTRSTRSPMFHQPQARERKGFQAFVVPEVPRATKANKVRKDL
jgi:hypothetical protein